MNYMTPDLLVRLQDDSAVDAASEEWEKNIAAYTEHLRAIRKDLPRGVRRLTGRLCLHDAEVLAIGLDKQRPLVVIVLKLDEPAGEIVMLQYVLLKKPEVVSHRSLEQFGRPWRRWLYDEFDAVEENGVRFFRHAVLFSGGQEMRLSFLDARRQVVQNYPDQLLSGLGAEGGWELQPA